MAAAELSHKKGHPGGKRKSQRGIDQGRPIASRNRRSGRAVVKNSGSPLRRRAAAKPIDGPAWPRDQALFSA